MIIIEKEEKKHKQILLIYSKIQKIEWKYRYNKKQNTFN